MVLALVAMMVLPAGIYAAIKIVNRMFPSQPTEVPVPLAIDARLRRMEDAIEAMAQQIERMRTGDRYVSGDADDMPLLPPSDDPQTFS
ncbi:MAG: hypothetical protein H7066_06355 [Cytophagaceae bacterium]|nr:hypothetical protein [Gemmatimonadaceae bacterium]